MKSQRGILQIIGLIAAMALAFGIYHIENRKRILKEDLIELSKVKYGLFNVDEWTEVLSDILSNKIDEFDLDDANKDEMRAKISSFLSTVVKELEASWRKDNEESALFGVSLKNTASDVFGIFNQIEKDIPNITEQVLTFMEQPENREKIKRYLTKKLETYTSETFAQIDYTLHDQILTRYNATSRKAAINTIEGNLYGLNHDNRPIYGVLFVLILIQGLTFIFGKNPTAFSVTITTVFAFVLLLLGLYLPMIDIDARISHMTFSLMGESVIFEDQVLYFKSKSILEVVELMLFQGKPDLMAVGVLVLLFSVIFPISKLASTLLITYRQALRKNAFFNFMVFKTGKWSMADVMVVAIFMAYIGFSGILTEQLNQLEHISPQLDILTTNQSTLQLGFFAFTGFVVLSLLISQRISNEPLRMTSPTRKGRRRSSTRKKK